jgi:1-acyl-sn-glycerol-3-phosphate acyltransferase
VVDTMSKVDTFLVGSSRTSRGLYRVARNLVVLIVHLVTRVRIEGREHLPSSGAYVLAPVHRSYLDTPIVAALTKRRLRYMGKDSLWKYGWSGWLCSALGAFPVSRGTADREALKRCITVLESGEPLVLFPEGERKSGSEVQPLFQGASYVAVKAGVPVVPVGIGGSERLMPKGARMIRPHRVVIVVGEPIVPSAETQGAAARETVRETTALLHTTLQSLFDDAQERALTARRN